MIGLTSISNRRTNNAIDYCGLNFWKVLTSAENNNNNNIFFDVFIAILWRWCIFYLSHLVTKPTKWHVRPAKTQISPVWSESSLCAQWVAKDLSFLHADSEDWSDWVDAQAELCLRWAHSHIVGFVMRRLIFLSSSRWQSVWILYPFNADIKCRYLLFTGCPKKSCTVSYEPHHEKTCLCHMQSTKVQTSLRTRAVWSHLCCSLPR